MLITSVRPLPRRLLTVIAVGAAALTASFVTATVTSPGQVLALPGASESTVVTVEPTRVLDTRYNVGLSGAFHGGVSRKLTVTGDVVTYFEPTDTRTTKTVVPLGATGVLLNVTGVAATAPGWIAVRPGDATGLPSTSNLNLTPGQIVPNAVTVAVPTTGSGAGQVDITYGPPSGGIVNIIVDIVGYTTNTGLLDLTDRVVLLETAPQIDAASAKNDSVDNATDINPGSYGVALSVLVVADSVGTIQIVGGAQVLAVGAADSFFCRLTRGSGVTANASTDDLADTDRGEYLPANRVGNCTTNGTVAVGPGEHVINLVVRKDAGTSLIDDATLQAIFIPGGFLDNSD